MTYSIVELVVLSRCWPVPHLHNLLRIDAGLSGVQWTRKLMEDPSQLSPFQKSELKQMVQIALEDRILPGLDGTTKIVEAEEVVFDAELASTRESVSMVGVGYPE